MNTASAGVAPCSAARRRRSRGFGGLQVQVGDEIDACATPAGDGSRATVRASTAAARHRDGRTRLDRDGLLDHDVLDRHVVVEALAAGLHGLDLVDHVVAVDDLAEHRVAPALRRGRGVVEEAVVGDVDEELRGRRMRRAGARHRHACSCSFFRPLLASFCDRRIGRLLLHAGLEAAALDHEAGDDAVEHGVVVVALVHVGEEVRDRLRAPCPGRARA